MSFITFILGLVVGVVIGFCVCFHAVCEEMLDDMTPEELAKYFKLFEEVKND